jgi:hypothetical protein
VAFDDRLRAAFDRALADVREAAASEMAEVRVSAELSAAEVGAATALLNLSLALQTLDDAGTLGAVLAAAAHAARHEPGGAVVFLVKNDALVPYPSSASVGVSSSLESVARRALGGGPESPDPTGVAVPIVVGGTTVAVLCAEGPASASTLEILARHAGRVLEGITLRRITGMSV